MNDSTVLTACATTDTGGSGLSLLEAVEQSKEMTNMFTQEFFSVVSAICLISSILLTAVNIFITRNTSLKVSRINQKLGVDFKLHKALMNQIAVFLATIDERKMRVLNSRANDQSVPSIIIKNQEEMNIAYNKLILISNYSNRDFGSVKHNLDSLMEKYNRVYELLGDSIYKMQLYNNYSEDRKENASGLIKQYVEIINEYNDLLHDKKLYNGFMYEINNFIRNEVKAIREFSI
jgi:hypothetical protein